MFMEKAWEGLSIDLWRFTEGHPRGVPGLYNSKVLTVLKVLEGQVVFKTEGEETCVRKGEWMMHRPGWREQLFDNDLRILSVHVAVDSHFPGADWRGVSAVHLPCSQRLDTAVQALRQTAFIQKLLKTGESTPTFVAADLATHLNYQEKVCAFVSVLTHILEPLGIAYTEPQIGDERVRMGLAKLTRMSLHEVFSRESMAQESGMSPSQMDRCWRAEIGMTPYIFWQQRRLKFACRELLKQGCLVKEVAYSTGFPRVSHFSQWFYSHQKETPSEYRKRHMGK